MTVMVRSRNLLTPSDRVLRSSIQTQTPRPIREFSSPFIMTATSEFFRILLHSSHFKYESYFDLFSYGIDHETQKILRFIMETGNSPVGYNDSLLRQLNIAMDMLLVYDP